jgi:hypothetical protein
MANTTVPSTADLTLRHVPHSAIYIPRPNVFGGMETLLRQAMELKDEGNAYFREAAWHDALQSYLAGLARLPPRAARMSQKGKEKELDDDDEAAGLTEASRLTDATDERTRPEIECGLMRSVLNGNAAACHVKMVIL